MAAPGHARARNGAAAAPGLAGTMDAMTHSLHLSDLLPGPGVKAPEHLEPETLDHVTEALTVLGALLPLNSRDFSADPLDAVLYGVLVGWGCEEHPAGGPHDEDCGGDGAFDEVADTFGWSSAQRERIRRYRAAVRAMTGD